MAGGAGVANVPDACVAQRAIAVGLVRAPAQTVVETVYGQCDVCLGNVSLGEEFAGDTGLIGGDEVIAIIAQLALVIIGAQFVRELRVLLDILSTRVAAIGGIKGIMTREAEALFHCVHDVRESHQGLKLS